MTEHKPGWLHETNHPVKLPKIELQEDVNEHYWVQIDGDSLWLVAVCDECGYLCWKEITRLADVNSID